MWSSFDYYRWKSVVDKLLLPVTIGVVPVFLKN